MIRLLIQYLAEIAKDTNKESVNATITMVSSGQFNVTNDIVGKQLESDKLKKEIKSKINGVLSEDVISIKAPVKDLKPKVTAAAIKNNKYKNIEL